MYARLSPFLSPKRNLYLRGENEMRRPFHKKSHRAWYATIAGKQVRLGTDKEGAEKEYHRLMASDTPVTTKTTAAQLIDQLLHWTKLNKSPRTFEW